MDKETLSNYGWVVIVLIVLALMISLATPFGSVLSKNIKESTTKLMGVTSDSLNNVTKYESFDDLNAGGGSGGGPGGGSSGEVGEPPVLLAGDGQEVNKVEENPFVFRSSAAYDTFKEVRVDDEVVDRSNYTVSEGSTIITFKWEFAITLTVGNHTISIVSTSGSANGAFDVVERAHVDEETGEILDSWDEIIATVKDGTYSTRYAVGNYKPLDLGSEGVINMQIAAFNSTTLKDGYNKAHITWVAKELLATKHQMNPQNVYTGWAESSMRSYLKNDVWALVPANVQSAILEARTASGYYDKLWIPLRGQFDSVKTLNGVATDWWTREPYKTSTEFYYFVSSSGTCYASNYAFASISNGVALCFCM